MTPSLPSLVLSKRCRPHGYHHQLFPVNGCFAACLFPGQPALLMFAHHPLFLLTKQPLASPSPTG